MAFARLAAAAAAATAAALSILFHQDDEIPRNNVWLP